ncbi:MAG TPA: PHP domain-containing protein, partial [Desulfobacteria bacterium]|nr:PHP domain-containing protein [Desulfobacteria bacterium]
MDNFEEIIKIDNGAKFHQCDLHVHTPASYNYRNKGIKPDDIVSEALAKELDVIAITDHHNVTWCDAVRKAAENTTL